MESSHHGSNPLWSKDRKKILKTEDEVKDHWREHFEDLLNQKTTIDEEVLNSIPQRPIYEDMADPPSLSEVCDTISAMRNNKAACPDRIPAEILKAGGVNLHQHIYVLIKKIWDLELIPSDLRDALIVILFKKGDKADCGNYRGIFLLSTTGKIIARILFKRLLPLSGQILPESQCGFRLARGTTDMIFTARQLQEKCKEQRQALYMAFIDLTKAFDSVRPSGQSSANVDVQESTSGS